MQICHMLRMQAVDTPKIQRQIWEDAARGVDERFGEKALCAKLLNTTVARRMITKEERMVEAGNPPFGGARWISVKFRLLVSGGSRLRAKRGPGLQL